MMKRVSHRRTDEHSRTAGFSLVELIVVVAMTAVLTALILPSLSSAKEKSRRTVCKGGNLKQLYIVLHSYADDNGDVLPSSADNIGNYHSIRLSDQTFTNLVDDYAGGLSNLFYCPNLLYAAGPNGLLTQDAYGTIIGYSYLVSNIVFSTKGADAVPTPVDVKLSTLTATNELMADANYWMPGATGSGVKAIAPHCASGAMVFGGGKSAAGAASVAVPSSMGLGAVGGNIMRADGSVYWRSISSMQTNSASSVSDALGIW